MPVSITITVVGADRGIAVLTQDRTPIIEGHMEQIVAIVRENVRGEVPVYKDSTGQRPGGSLKRSIASHREGFNSWVVTESEPYGRFVRQGVAPRMIYPTRAGALWWPGLRHPIKQVRVSGWPWPGIQANDYPARGVNKAQPAVEGQLVALGHTIEQSMRW